MSELRLELQLLPDGQQQLVLSLPQEGPYVMNASDAETLVQAVSQQRQRMKPDVPHHSPPGPRSAILDPRWYVAHETLVDGCALHLRHPGLGWLSFAVPLQSLRDLQQAIANVLDQVQHEQESLRPN